MASTRRLTAILAADVAGYSRLMGADEEGTHERLKAHLRELGLPRHPAGRRDRPVDEPQGKLLGQCADGELLRHPENRARSPERVPRSRCWTAPRRFLPAASARRGAARLRLPSSTPRSVS